MGILDLSRRNLMGRFGDLARAPRVLFGGAAHAHDHALDAEWLATAGVEGGFAPVMLGADYAATQVKAGAQRLHWVEPNPDGRTAIAVARRPGTMAVLFECRSGAVLATFEPGEGRVFSGHGRFIDGGRRFLAVEIERASGQGVVTRRVVEADFAIEAEWASAGIGPHDMLPAGGALVVANGGVEPHTPEAVGAEVAGASVARLDPQTGEVRSVAELGEDLESLSLRHLASGPDGLTVIAAQDLLADGMARPLVYAVEGEGLRAFDAPEEEWRGLRTYVGSVAVDASGSFVAAASPRGNRVAVWKRDGRFLGSLTLVDGCGLAPTREGGQFLATSGLGEVALIAADEVGVGVVARRSGGPRFDNHAVLAAG
ncbi:DUF1513 domain-containing protein [Ancylobacter mangrovi]|uniref:DUF1513 domain-containing protein n=1 Tax=Ancylobacter mangrovi TaxID=2972472 RepID=UPI00216149F1|nr:DUF1513 domain-containing protein [Ancylobacter mangrovi]MCS0501850.1 DUF1513 domain-containing protein [Ancylobacter mangrovi]